MFQIGALLQVSGVVASYLGAFCLGLRKGKSGNLFAEVFLEDTKEFH